MKCYIVDTFTDIVFKGNPAAVCLLDQWVPSSVMLNIAQENNLSETAFIVSAGEDYELRWFTPKEEIDLCGHATMAAAYIILRFVDPTHTKVTFHTKSGALIVHKKQDLYEMDMPSYSLRKIPVTNELEQAIGIKPVEAWLGRDLVCILENEEQIYHAQPNMEKVMHLDGLLLHLTAKGKNYDCVSRSFAPKLGVLEDPVCGSGHCHIIPLWNQKNGKQSFHAYQASKRGGHLYCHLSDERVIIAGEAVLYSIAELFI